MEYKESSRSRGGHFLLYCIPPYHHRFGLKLFSLVLQLRRQLNLSPTHIHFLLPFTDLHVMQSQYRISTSHMHIVQSLRVNEFFASAVAGTVAHAVGSLVEF